MRHLPCAPLRRGGRSLLCRAIRCRGSENIDVKIDPVEASRLAAEFRANSKGPHGPTLQHLLSTMRGLPIRGKHILIFDKETGECSGNCLPVLADVPLNYSGLGGSENPLVRADIAFFEMPSGGAVFSTGSIALGRARSRTTATPTTSPTTPRTCSAALSIPHPWTRPC